MASQSASLVPTYFFGIKSEIPDNIYFLEENIITYISGNIAIVYYLDTKVQKLFHPTDNCESITSICVPPTRRVISLCEKLKKGALISLYDFPSLKRRKPLTINDSNLPFMFSDFSSDSKYLAVQECGPIWGIYIFNWEKNKLICSLQPPIDHGKSVNYFKFHPTDPTILITSGSGVLTFYRILEGVIKAMPLNTFKKELGNILCHSYISDKRCIICTDNGELILFENTGSCIELRSYLQVPATHSSAIYSIISTSKGFIIGTHDTTIRIYEESDDATEFYHIYRTIKGRQGNDNIKSLALSPSEDVLLCSTSNGEVLQLNLGNIDILKPEEIKLDIILGPFHGPNSSGSHKINDLSMALRKPLLLTCGVDRTVRVWNYIQHTVDLCVKFEEDILAVSFHPSGLFGAVSFISKLKLVNILHNNIIPYFEFPIKACYVVKFSSGGHRIAASSQSNSVIIIDVNQCQVKYELPGHVGKIDSIEWANHDQYLFTACKAGYIMQWDMLTGIKMNEYKEKSYSWSQITAKFDGSTIYASAYKADNENTSILCVIEFPTLFSSTPTLKQETELSGYRIGDLVFSNFNQTLYTSQANFEKPGSICSIKFPIGELPTPVLCHSDKGVKLLLTYDEKTLVSVGEDGSIGVFQIKSSLRSLRECRIPFSDEVLVQDKDIEQQEQLLKSLEDKITEYTLKNEKQLKEKEKSYEMTIYEAKSDFESMVKVELQNIEDITNDIEVLQNVCTQKMSKLKTDFEKETIELDISQKGKIDAEIKRYNLLCEERDKLNASNDKENQILLNSHARHKEEVIKNYTDQINIINEECNKLLDEKEKAIQERRTIENDLETDCESEIHRMNRLTKQKMQDEIDYQEELAQETQQLLGTLNSLKESKNDYEKQKETLKKNEVKKCTSIRGLEKDIIGHKKEIKEREDTIADKDKRIHELNRKNQELEKFKFVLDYKIKELKRQIKPRQDQITRLKQQILEMDQELEQYHRSNASLKLMIGELKMKSFGMKNDLDGQKKLFNDALGVVERFRNDLHDCYNKIDDHKALKIAITHLFSKYVRDYDKEGSQNDTQIQDEYNRRREYLEKNVNSIKQKISKEIQNGHVDKLRLMRENSMLTQEINNLRREMRLIKQSEKASRFELLKQMSNETNSNESLENKKLIDLQQNMIYQLIQKLKSLGGVLDIPPPSFDNYQTQIVIPPNHIDDATGSISNRRSAKL